MSSTPLRNLSRRTKVYWKDYEHWSCGRHLPALVLPAGIDQCWLCSNKRPPMDDRPPMPEGFEEQKAKPKAKAKAKNIPKRVAPRRQPSELDAMLTGSVAASLDAEIEPKPAKAPAKAPKKAAPKPTAASTAAVIDLTKPADVRICAWEGCNEPARPRSKYCSRNCSNKNARARHKARVK